MKAGALDRRITLLRATTTRSGLNTPVKGWGELATVSASRQDVSDAERQRAQQIGAAITSRFQIRWSSDVADVSPLDQLTCEGRRYQITGVKELGRRTGLELTATAIADPAP